MVDDLISRQAVMDSIIDLLEIEWGYEGIREDAQCIFNEIPAAVDAVEVVRCGTPCRWLYNDPDDYCCMNHKGLLRITPDSFCSYGERREENAAD